MQPLQRITYISRVHGEPSEAQLQRLVGVAQVSNRRVDVTGVLVCTGAHFAQVLEGRTDVLDALVARIARDPRHTDLRLLAREPLQQRMFDRWQMHLVLRLELSDLLEQAFSGDDGAAVAARLLAVLQNEMQD